MKKIKGGFIIESGEEHKEFLLYCAYFAPETKVEARYTLQIKDWQKFDYPKTYPLYKNKGGNKRYYNAVMEFIKIQNDNKS